MQVKSDGNGTHRVEASTSAYFTDHEQVFVDWGPDETIPIGNFLGLEVNWSDINCRCLYSLVKI